MPPSHCSTCHRPLCTCLKPRAACQCSAPVCACPAPPPPDTLGRVTRLQEAKAALLQAVIATPGQQAPTMRAWVDATIQRIRDADEAEVAQMAQAAGLAPARTRGAKMPPGEFFVRWHAMRSAFFAKHERWPTQAEIGAALGMSRRTLSRYLHPRPRPKKNAPKKRPKA